MGPDPRKKKTADDRLVSIRIPIEMEEDDEHDRKYRKKYKICRQQKVLSLLNKLYLVT